MRASLPINSSPQTQRKPTAAWASDFIQNQSTHATPPQVIHASQNMDTQIDMQPKHATPGPKTQGEFHEHYRWVKLISENALQVVCNGTPPFPISAWPP